MRDEQRAEPFPNGGYPEFGKDIIWSADLMVLKLKKGTNGSPPKIDQMLGIRWDLGRRSGRRHRRQGLVMAGAG